MHSRDYSDETARVIDEEVEHILRDEEERCRKVLEEYRAGLDAVAQALLERETLAGEEVANARRHRHGPQGRRAPHDPPRRRHRRARDRRDRRPADQPRPDALAGSRSPSDHVEDERFAVVRDGAGRGHAEAFHHCARADVGRLGECDDLFGAELGEHELDAGTSRSRSPGRVRGTRRATCSRPRRGSRRRPSLSTVRPARRVTESTRSYAIHFDTPSAFHACSQNTANSRACSRDHRPVIDDVGILVQRPQVVGVIPTDRLQAQPLGKPSHVELARSSAGPTRARARRTRRRTSRGSRLRGRRAR